MLVLGACYTDRPIEITYMALPGGGADVWLRKYIKEAPDVSEDGHPMQTSHWEAEEAYMRFDSDPPTEAAIKFKFTTWYETAAVWQLKQPACSTKETLEERLISLESENKMLYDQLNTVMDVVDYLLMGG